MKCVYYLMHSIIILDKWTQAKPTTLDIIDINFYLEKNIKLASKGYDYGNGNVGNRNGNRNIDYNNENQNKGENNGKKEKAPVKYSFPNRGVVRGNDYGNGNGNGNIGNGNGNGNVGDGNGNGNKGNNNGKDNIGHNNGNQNIGDNNGINQKALVKHSLSNVMSVQDRNNGDRSNENDEYKENKEKFYEAKTIQDKSPEDKYDQRVQERNNGDRSNENDKYKETKEKFYQAKTIQDKSPEDKYDQRGREYFRTIDDQRSWAKMSKNKMAARERNKEADCQEGNGKKYRGSVSQTKDGDTCQNWIDMKPNYHHQMVRDRRQFGVGEHNFCRNPDGAKGVWCYGTRMEKRWEYCDVPVCS